MNKMHSLDHWRGQEDAFLQYADNFGQSMAEIARDCGAAFSRRWCWSEGDLDECLGDIMGLSCKLDFSRISYYVEVIDFLEPYTCRIWSSETMFQFGDNILSHCREVPIIGLAGYIKALSGADTKEVSRHRP